MTRLYRLILVALLISLLTGCPRPVAPPDTDPRLAPLALPRAAERYRIDPAASLLQVFVYREGRLARLGHNHVISSTGLVGEVYLGERLADSAVELRLPVASLEVDRPELRAAAGADFPGELDAQAIAGTRGNMLGEQQLDGERWPVIVLRSRGISGADAEWVLTLDVALKSAVRRLEVPVILSRSERELRVSGRLSVAQSELGLEPFSALLGALRTRDRLDISFALVARAAD